MRHPLHFTLVTAFAGVLVLSLAWKHHRPLTAATPGDRPGPRTMREVTAVADALGLYTRSDSVGGWPTGKLFVSARPLTYEGVQHLYLHGPAAAWVGVVAVQFDAVDVYTYNFDPDQPDRSALWGTTFAYGDPTLIERLAAAGR